jgi:hypothetical protein
MLAMVNARSPIPNAGIDTWNKVPLQIYITEVPIKYELNLALLKFKKLTI